MTKFDVKVLVMRKEFDEIKKTFLNIKLYWLFFLSGMMYVLGPYFDRYYET